MTHAAVQQAEITLTVNGERSAQPSGSTLGDLLRAHSLDARMVVVEYDGQILHDRTAYDSLELADGGIVEIVHFVGGG